MYSFSVFRVSVLSRRSGIVLCWGIICPQAWQTCRDTLPFFLKRTFPSLAFCSFCEVLTAGMDWAADKFVWVCLPNGNFHPGERSSTLVWARPPIRKCCHSLWYAEFPNRQLYSGSWVVLRWAMVPMAAVNGGYNCRHADLEFVGLPSLLLRF